MGNVNMEARQIHYRGGNKPMSVEEAIKEAGGDLPIASVETLGGVKIGDGLSITEAGMLSVDSKILDYSTTEQKTGEKWIDGRPVYIRTFDFSSSPVAVAFNSWTSLGVSIPNCGILLKCNATSGITNLSASGIEFEIKSNENYGLYAEYNQNINVRSISYLTCKYVKESQE